MIKQSESGDWRAKMESEMVEVKERLTALEATQRIHTGLLIAILVALVASMWVG